MKELKEVSEHLKKFSGATKEIVPIKEREIAYYKMFVEFLCKYEETNLKKATQQDQAVGALVSGHNPVKTSLKDKMEEEAQKNQNPFKHIRNWIKSEIHDAKGMLECISKKDGMDAKRS